MGPRYPEPDNLHIFQHCLFVTVKEQQAAEQQALQLPNAFLPHAAAAPDYYGQQPQATQTQQPGAAAYPPHEVFGGATQQPGAHVPVPHQYPSMGEAGLQHHLLPHTVPRPAAPPAGIAFPGGVPAAPPQVYLHPHPAAYSYDI